MKLETPLVAMLIAGLFFTGMYIVFIGLADNYDVSYDVSQYTTETSSGNESIWTAMNKINQTKSSADELSEQFYNLEPKDTGSIWFWLSMAWQMSSVIFQGLGAGVVMLTTSASILGIPGIVVAVLATILVLTFIVTVILILLGRIT